MPLSLRAILLGSVIFSAAISLAEDSSKKGRRSVEAIGAFSRGESLSWDQLEVVATEAGISREKIAEIKLKDRLARLIQTYHLRLEVSKFSSGLLPDEEFRLYKSPRPGWGALVLNSNFWAKAAGTSDTDAYLTYVLFRAEAYYLYLTHYDAEQCAWIVGEESPSMEMLRSALDGSETRWVIDQGSPSERDLEFRRTLDPTSNPSRTLKLLIEYALRAVAQKAADDASEYRLEREVGKIPPLVKDRIGQRERALAADFNRARSAMTRAERLAFQKLLKSPFRYARRHGAVQSEPAYDPEIKTPLP